MDKFNPKQKIIILSITLIILIVMILIFFLISKNRTKGKIQPKKAISSPTKAILENAEVETFAEKDKKFEMKEMEFYKKNPLSKYVPYYGEHFEINHNGKTKNGIVGYKITLYVVLNNPNQFEQYKEDYLKYKIEAIEWIKSKGIDYTKLDIEWVPEDPKNINFNQKTEIYPGKKSCKACR